MRLVVSGASGFVGQMLVPALSQRGADLVLVGRNMDKLQSIFPHHIVSTYDDLARTGADADLFVNLAVLNNDQTASIEDQTRVNADFAAELARTSTQNGAWRFVNVSSIHALDETDMRPYAVSKRAGIAAVDAEIGDRAIHLYLPAIFGQRFSGALSPLNALPKPVAQALLGPLSALKPILPVSDLTEWMMAAAMTAERHVVLTRGQRNNDYYSAGKRLFDLRKI
jgi:nucleoside-diphosphate-sugar epimerase